MERVNQREAADVFGHGRISPIVALTTGGDRDASWLT
jgi:hypothetical protein